MSVGAGRRVLVASMRDEAIFLLEWLAFHRLVGFNEVMLFTNDCSDGTDAMADRLQALGLLRHFPNPVEGQQRPQGRALSRIRKERMLDGADWVMGLDADEFLNIHAGAGTLDDLTAAVPEADAFFLNWRHYGDPDRIAWEPGLVLSQFTRASRPRDPQNSSVKTLFRRPEVYRQYLVHVPWDPHPEEGLRVVNGSGRPVEGVFGRTVAQAIRLTGDERGTDLAQVNHYATKSLEAYVMKKMRGTGDNTPIRADRAYWETRNRVVKSERSILRHLPALTEAREALLADPELAALQARAEAWFGGRIAEARTAGLVTLDALDRELDPRGRAARDAFEAPVARARRWLRRRRRG
ncbi:MAG: glycosyltransferase family 2 protein [Pseudomonadota bacterium]